MAPPFISSVWKDTSCAPTNVWEMSNRDRQGQTMVSSAKPIKPVMFDQSLTHQLPYSAAPAQSDPIITRVGIPFMPAQDQIPVSTKPVSPADTKNEPSTQNLLSTAKSVSRNDILHGVTAVLEHFVAMSDQEFIVPPPTPFDGPEYKTTSIFSKLEQIMNSGVCSKECFIIAVIFGERLLQSHPDFHISRYNVHRLILVSIMVASKILDDFYCRNAYYANVGGLDNKTLNALELKLTFMLNFRLAVDLEEFSLYCSALIRDPTQISAGSWTGPSERDVVAKHTAMPHPLPTRPAGSQPFPHPGAPAYGIPQQPVCLPPPVCPTDAVYVTPAGQGYTLLHPRAEAQAPSVSQLVNLPRSSAPGHTLPSVKSLAPPPPSQGTTSVPDPWQHHKKDQQEAQGQQLNQKKGQLQQKQQHQHQPPTLNHPQAQLQQQCRQHHHLPRQQTLQQPQQPQLRYQQQQQKYPPVKQQSYSTYRSCDSTAANFALPFPHWNPPSAHSLPHPPAGWLLTPAGV